MGIPEDADELTLKILIDGHCGGASHREKRATGNTVRENLEWMTQAIDVLEFVQDCLHCVIFKAGERVLRPLATSLHGQSPNEVAHMDSLYMGDEEGSELKYLFVTKDDLRGYTLLAATIHDPG